ncbi:23S rRNA (pseudouridine1915-N3)-methyltransferase [Balneicella halophila]|uniref:Ribosomal RNA large subunit methyltransferase H n=1 Tax=Balneicella halophila TaxID=1537566 RepID=A0A7L4URG7_BALHA|nr:23S rRNA (pseudouridine(1915)-N(3))-methyltransferase RlmH [Balneicella halophila]PVX52368.1 23S rRNA (pseudouridine1915-N3)-methyltransferase [Balneicella halophila]
MKVQIICIGKTAFSYLDEGIDLYEKRLKHYLPFEWIIVPEIKKAKNWSADQIKQAEGQALVKIIPSDSVITLLDVKGKTFTSEEFASFLNTRMISGVKTLSFIIGGAYGFSPEIYAKAQFKISLSKMTFSHQLVRVVFSEQLYRAMTILRSEPYHH